VGLVDLLTNCEKKLQIKKWCNKLVCCWKYYYKKLNFPPKAAKSYYFSRKHYKPHLFFSRAFFSLSDTKSDKKIVHSSLFCDWLRQKRTDCLDSLALKVPTGLFWHVSYENLCIVGTKSMVDCKYPVNVKNIALANKWKWLFFYLNIRISAWQSDQVCGFTWHIESTAMRYTPKFIGWQKNPRDGSASFWHHRPHQ